MNHPVKAKETSKWAQIIAALWIAGWSVRKFLTSDEISIGDIITSGLAIAGCFTPVYFSILMDKFKGREV